MSQILIIDDEEEWCERILYKPLVRLNYEVKTAKSHDNALQLIEQHEFDLVVTNVRLDMAIKKHMITPRWTELLDAIERKSTKMIIVTSQAFPPPLQLKDLMRIAFRDFRVVDFLFKEGFNTREYEQAVQSVVKIDNKKSSNALVQQNENTPQSPLPLSFAHRKRLQQLLADLPGWKLGQHQDRYGLLLFIGLPDNYITDLSLDGSPEIVAAITITALGKVGYTVDIPEYTGLGLLVRHLYENTPDLETKVLYARMLIDYNMTTESNCLADINHYLHT